MKILIDINHPGHVHFFKYIIWLLKKRGHNVIITASKKDKNFELLRNYNFKFINIGTFGNNKYKKIFNLILMEIKLFFIILIYNPSIIAGIASFRGSHIGWLFRKKIYIFDDTEHSSTEINLYKPFATKIFTPECFFKNLGKKQIKYKGYHELAYLHPNYFKPNPKVLKEANLNPIEKFFIVRFVSWKAYHDTNQKGFSEKGKERLVDLLNKHGKVIITSESPLPESLKKYKSAISPEKIHDLLYYATIYIGEGGTMASESAVLGTPSIFMNTLTNGYLMELEEKYNLLKRFTQEELAFQYIKTLLNRKNLKKEWRIKRATLLKEKIDVTNFLINEIIKN